MNNILTLPSVNLEIYFDTQRSSYKGYAKIPIVDYAVSIGGSSLNIAMAIKAGGLDPTLFAFVSKDNPDGLIDTLLFHLNKLRVTNKLFPILKQDSIALIDRATGHPDIIKGYRSPFCEGNQLFTEIRQAKDQYDFKIFSGASERDIDMVNVLFTGDSTNVLVPRKDLLVKHGLHLKSIFPNVDILCIDYQEFLASGVKDIRNFNYHLVTITNEGNEGIFCFHNQIGNIKPKLPETGKQIFPTGAGDWFCGSLCALIDRENISVKSTSVPMSKIEEVVQKATDVASLKILYPHAIEGPSNY